MFLEKLVVRQFRSYSELSLSVDPAVNLFVGLNGAGKTNVLEAIAVLTTGISPRGGETESFIQWGQHGFYIGGTFQNEEKEIQPLQLEMKYQAGSPRVIRENGKNVIRLKDLIGRIPMVSFVPEDLALIKGEPSLRRRAVNMILMQVDKEYVEALKKYTEVLRSRNAALRQRAERSLTEEALEPWDAALVHWGALLCEKRQRFLEDFSHRTKQIHKRLSGGREQLELEYKPSFAGPWDEEGRVRWLAKLASLRSQEIALGMSLTGPHRDDILFLLNSRPARAFASEGQSRTSAVAFKLAEISHIEDKTGQRPICLLDDVLSELDAERAAHLLDELTRTGQCFVTMTGLESWPANHARPATIFRVEDSVVALEPSFSGTQG